MSHNTLAFVGLGAIGLPMATSLVRSGFDIVGVDPVEAGRARAAEHGIRPVPSVAEIGAASIVVVMVATPEQLAAVVDGALAADVVDGRHWIVMSTVGPDAVRREAARIVAAGGHVVDAPVSGGIPRASAGTLTLFVSGAAAAIAEVDAVLRAMGTPHVVGGEVGDGQAVKVVNQHLCAVHIAAAAEALALAESLGLDASAVLDVVSQGAAASFMLSDRGPRMLQGEEAPVLSQIGIFVKDTGLVADAATESATAVPLLAAARERFLLAESMGLKTRDDSSVIDTYRDGGQ